MECRVLAFSLLLTENKLGSALLDRRKMAGKSADVQIYLHNRINTKPESYNAHDFSQVTTAMNHQQLKSQTLHKRVIVKPCFV